MTGTGASSDIGVLSRYPFLLMTGTGASSDIGVLSRHTFLLSTGALSRRHFYLYRSPAWTVNLLIQSQTYFATNSGALPKHKFSDTGPLPRSIYIDIQEPFPDFHGE
jgi:hypothetical protein